MKKEIDFNSIKPFLKNSNVKFAGVFGSFARGENRDDSDIDILVKFNNPIGLLSLIRLEREISEKVGREVDLVTEDSLNPIVRENVMRDLKLIYG